MRSYQIFEIEDLFLNNKNNNSIIPTGQNISSRPPTQDDNSLSIPANWVKDERKLIIGTLVIVFILGFIFAKIIS